jgi:hypothetical protein
MGLDESLVLLTEALDFQGEAYIMPVQLFGFRQ